MRVTTINADDAKLNKRIYFMACLAFTVMIFFYLPSNLYHSDPAVFHYSLLSILIYTAPYAAGFLAIVSIIWIFSRYDALRRIITELALMLLIWALINLFVIVGDFGVFNAGVFANEAGLIGDIFWFRDFFASLLLALVLLILCTHSKIKKECVPLIGAIIVSMLSLTAYNGLSIKTVESQPPPPGMQNYSKTEENVVIITLDTFTGGHIAKMIEDPWFADFMPSMDGFTWYPDTMSSGYSTIFSLASVYGGPDYEPIATNKKGISLAENFNKAVAVLPRNFSAHGYETQMISGFYHFNMDLLKKYNGVNKNTHYIEQIHFDDTPGAKIFLPSVIKPTKLHLFTLAVSLFNISPHAFKIGIYDGAQWLGSRNFLDIDGEKEVANQLTLFYNTFNTKIGNSSKKPTLKMFYTMLPHVPWHLDKDELKIVTDPYPDTYGLLFFVDQINMEHYYTERHTMKILINYFNSLKDAGVYDNTKIILVSDHCFGGSQMIDDMFENNMKGKKVKWGSPEHNSYGLGKPHALLMMKDFNSRGELKISDSLMMNSDVPALAALSLPSFDEFTINDPRESPSNRIRYHIIGGWNWADHETDKYIIDECWQIDGTMFNLKNWKQISPD